VITTTYGDSAIRSVVVTCGGGSGSHALYNGSDAESLLVNGSVYSSFTISSNEPVAITWIFTCANTLTTPTSVATSSFVFNVNGMSTTHSCSFWFIINACDVLVCKTAIGCRTLTAGSLSYCEGIVPYPVDSRIDYREADARARALYENDAYNHWNATGWLPSPNVTLVYDNATDTYSNVTDTVTLVIYYASPSTSYLYVLAP
jgi:hypothetical protein